MRTKITLSPVVRDGFLVKRDQTLTAVIADDGFADDIEADGEPVGSGVSPMYWDHNPSNHFYLRIPVDSRQGAWIARGETIVECVAPSHLFRTVDAAMDHLIEMASGPNNPGCAAGYMVRFEVDGISRFDPLDPLGAPENDRCRLRSVGIVGMVPDYCGAMPTISAYADMPPRS